VRRDDELRARGPLEQQRQQPELVLGRQRCLGFVQQVQAVRHEPTLEQVEEGLPVRPRIRVTPVATLHVPERRAHRTGGEAFRVGRAIAVRDVDLREPLLELPPLGGEPALEPEEILGAEEEPAMRSLRPPEPQRGGESSLRRERAVPPDLGGPNGGEVGGGSHPLEQRGFPRAVLANEERDAGGEGERRQRPDRRDGKGEIHLAGGGRPLQAHPQELRRLRHRYPAACRLNSSAYRPPRATSSSCVPWSMSSPPCSTRIRSAMRTVEKRCEMSTAIRPFVSSANRRNTSYSARAASDAVGSSRISTWASRMYARPRATFCHSPPDSSTPPSNRRPSIWIRSAM